MKFLTLLAVFGFAGLASCQNGVPTFEWAQDEVSPDGVPLLFINFHDGRKNDVAILKHFNPIPKGKNERDEDIDNCIFDGFLRDEDKVYVTLTGGCPFENTFDIQFRSSRAVEHMFKVYKGKVTPLLSIFRREKVEDIALPTPGAKRTYKSANPQPRAFNLIVKMHYDQTFKAVFGGDSLNAMRRVTAQAQNVYYWPTLPTIVTLSVVAEQEIPNSINADQPSMDFVGATYANDPNINAFFFLSNQNDASPAAGLGYVNAVCGTLQYRIAISEYYYDDMTSAELMAHELGHNLGMNHDFLSSPSDPRYDSQGRICTGINGVMDYSTRNKWTTCSQEDFNGANHGCIAQK